ncbi:unnamed protein product, partial [Meganyctiphanes norvegica]
RIEAIGNSGKGLVATSRRDLERMVGYINFGAQYLPLGRLFLLPLVSWMNAHTLPALRDLPVRADGQLRTALLHWSDRRHLTVPVPMNIEDPVTFIMTDASLTGWCGIFQDQTISGGWNRQDLVHSMNWMELSAIHRTVQFFHRQLAGLCVRVFSDNTTALACIRRQGSLASPALLHLAYQLLSLCQCHRITLVPSHLKGVLNVLADQGSRKGTISTEWSLDPESFWWVCKKVGIPQVDLFATRDNTQLPGYVSPCPDSAALGMDAFSLDWNQWRSIYLFPPQSLVPQVCRRLAQFRGTGFLIASPWREQSWMVPLRDRCRTVFPLKKGYSLSQLCNNTVVFLPTAATWDLHVWTL